MGVLSFFKLGRHLDEKIQKILCLSVWVFGGAMLTFNYVDTVVWLLTYPHPNLFAGATCLMNLALRVFSMWMPMSFLLLEWRMKKISFLLYLIGGVVGILLSLVALGLTLPLLVSKDIGLEFANQYFSKVKPSIARGSMPATMKIAVSLENCCSWYGPADFGSEYDVTKHKDKHEEFMRDVQVCTGSIFEIQKQKNGYLKYTPGKSQAAIDLPQGCGTKILARANRIAIFIIIMTLIICVLTAVMLLLHFKIFKRLGLMASVNPARLPPQPLVSQPEVPVQDSTQSQGVGDGAEEKKAEQ